MAFVGLGYSWESYYQALRRCYRFGQKRRVIAHIVLSDLERDIYSTILAKEQRANELTAGLLGGMTEYTREEIFSGTSKGDEYEPQRSLTLPSWLRTCA
jgi:hypothetical protein